MTTQTIETKNGTSKHAIDPVVAATGAHIPIEQIHPSPFNPRKSFAGIDELAASVKEKGLVVPLLVRPTPTKKTPFEIVLGERRWRALQKAEETVVRCEVRELTDEQALELMLVEYVQREELQPLEEAAAFAQLLGKRKVEEIADKVKKPVPYVYRRLRLAGLSAKAKEALGKGDLLLGAAEQLARLDDHDAQDKALPQLIRRTDNGYEFKPLSAEQAKQVVLREMRRLKDAGFDTTLAYTACAEAGACQSCPKRTGAQAVLFGEAEDDDRCLDAVCWARKVKAHGELVIIEAKQYGKRVVRDSGIWDSTGERLRYDAPFVDLAEHRNGGEKWKKVLKDSGLPISVAVDSAGRAHDLAERKPAEAYAAKQDRAGPSGSTSASSSSAATGTKRVVDEAEKIEKAQQVALLSAVAAKAEKASPAAILRIVARSLAGRALGNDGVADLVERRGVKGAGAQTAFEGLVEKADLTKLQGIVAELLAADAYDTDEVCEALKIDVDAIEKKAADAFKATAKLEDVKGSPAKPTVKAKAPAKKAKAKAKKGGKKR